MLFVGLSQDLRSEEHLDYMSPPSPFSEELDKLQHEEMVEAQTEFGKGHEYEKLYLDLDLPESSDVLGPSNSVRTGEFV